MSQADITPDTPPLLAWAGWWLPLPASWRLVRIDGGFGKGMLALGDEERARLELSWAWVTRRSLNVPRYARRFLLEQLPRRERRKAKKDMETLRLPHFQTLLLLRNDKMTRAVGYSAANHRFLHWVYHHASRREEEQFLGKILPQWKDQPLTGAARWHFFNLSFSTPPGFRLRSARLNLGDMTIQLLHPTTWGSRRRLLIRFIYPANLALTRQAMDQWLLTLFKSSRGVYRASWSTLPQREGQNTLVLRARLQFLLRFFLRPLVFRIPGKAEASLHHLMEANKLLYLQVGGGGKDFEPIRNTVLQSLPDHGQDQS